MPFRIDANHLGAVAVDNKCGAVDVTSYRPRSLQARNAVIRVAEDAPFSWSVAT